MAKVKLEESMARSRSIHPRRTQRKVILFCRSHSRSCHAAAPTVPEIFRCRAKPSHEARRTASGRGSRLGRSHLHRRRTRRRSAACPYAGALRWTCLTTPQTDDPRTVDRRHGAGNEDHSASGTGRRRRHPPAFRCALPAGSSHRHDRVPMRPNVFHRGVSIRPGATALT